MTPRSLTPFLFLIGSACAGGKIEDVTYSDGLIPGVGIVTWAPLSEGTAHVEYGLSAEALDQRTPDVDASAGQATVLELQVATTYFFRVVVGDEASEVIEADIQPPPESAPPMLVAEVGDPSLACEPNGFVMLNYLGQDASGQSASGVVIVNRAGKYVWAVESESSDVQIARARLGRDGHSILWNTNDFARVDDIATIERMSIDGTTRTTTRTLNGHHDFVELPDQTTLAWLAYEVETPVPLGPEFPAEWFDYPVAYDVVYEAQEGATDADTPTVAFDFVRDWPEGIYYQEPTDFFQNCDTFLPGQCELGHGNSLAFVDETDQYQVGFRWLDATLRVGRTGEVDWVFGGPLNEFAGDEAGLPVHFHYSDVWADGMYVFDNHDPDPSRLMLYSFDLANKTFSVDWQFDLEENESLLGDVRRIPVEGCENRLVSRTDRGFIEELTPSGETAWRLYYRAGTGTGRVQYLSSVYDFADQAAGR